MARQVKKLASRNAEKIAGELDQELVAMREDVLARTGELLGRRVSLDSFHGMIASQKSRYTDLVRMSFRSPTEYIAHWLRGLNDRAGKRPWPTAADRLARLVSDRDVWRYLRKYFQRDFYRHYDARTREKPPENLWSIWFGSNKFKYGLLISPVLRAGEWTNDKSQMRREQYLYWTVGHAIAAGFVDPSEQEVVEFRDMEYFLSFYRRHLRKVSDSPYEKGLMSRYIDYVSDSTDPFSEPLLVPEFRYAGPTRDHQHRLDFAVFNSHVMEYSGFEVSPHSTHMAVKGMSGTSQAAYNRATALKWDAEMKKRNDYLRKYDIPTVTFTDSRLSDLDECFNDIRRYLSKRPQGVPSVSDELKRIRQRAGVSLR